MLKLLHMDAAITEAWQQVKHYHCMRLKPDGHGAAGTLRSAVLAMTALEVCRQDEGAKRLVLNLAKQTLEKLDEDMKAPQQPSHLAPGGRVGS